jgi:transposase-like protein
MSRKTQRYSKEFKAEAISTPHKMEDRKYGQ